MTVTAEKKLHQYLNVAVRKSSTPEHTKELAWAEMNAHLGKVVTFNGRQFIPRRAEIVGERQHVYFDRDDVILFTFRVYGEEIS